MRTSRRVLFLCASAALASGAFINACSPAGEHQTNTELGEAALTVAGTSGFTIATVTYSITGPSSFSKTGPIDVSNSSTIATTIGSWVELSRASAIR